MPSGCHAATPAAAERPEGLLAGRLVQPFGPRLAVPYGYWIVGPRATSGLPKVVAFRDWLLREAAEDTHRLREILT